MSYVARRVSASFNCSGVPAATGRVAVMSEAGALTPRLAGVVHPNKPICDGFCFDELYGLRWEERQRAMASGFVWATEFKAVDARTRKIGTFCGNVMARDVKQAIAECEVRGLGERVVGQMGGFHA